MRGDEDAAIGKAGSRDAKKQVRIPATQGMRKRRKGPRKLASEDESVGSGCDMTTEQMKGVRADQHPKRVPDDITTGIVAGQVCYLCKREVDDSDLVCDSKSSCWLSFHKACEETWAAKHSWKNRVMDRCPCQDCLHCGEKFRNGQAGLDDPYVRCTAHVHLQCAEAHDYYCIVCFHPYWPPNFEVEQ